MLAVLVWGRQYGCGAATLAADAGVEAADAACMVEVVEAAAARVADGAAGVKDVPYMDL